MYLSVWQDIYSQSIGNFAVYNCTALVNFIPLVSVFMISILFTVVSSLPKSDYIIQVAEQLKYYSE